MCRPSPPGAQSRGLAEVAVSEGTVVVTGATRGIGRATVDAILERGGRVVGIARDAEALATLEALHRHRVRGVPADLSEVDGLLGVAERAHEAFGGIDGLVNCAGIVRYEAVGEIRAESVDAQVRVNWVAPLLLSQAVSDRMRARGGAIVNVSSTLSERVAPLTAVYAATKAALNAVTKSLALELAPHGIRVNAVLPGGVDTDMLRVQPESRLAALRAMHPLGRLGTAAEVATVVVGALDQPWQTGSLITIDGGLSLS